MRHPVIIAVLVALLSLHAVSAQAERKYLFAGLQATLPDTWIDIDSQVDFLRDRQRIAAYTAPGADEQLPLVRIVEVAAPGNERGMVTFSIKPCYRGECPDQDRLRKLSNRPAAGAADRQLLTADGSRLLDDFGTRVEPGCGGYFVERGQKVEARFGGIYISKQRMFYRDSYVVGVAIGYAEAAAPEVRERSEAALRSFSCASDRPRDHFR